VNDCIIQDIAEDLEKQSPKDFQRYHVVSFDEMYIRKNLVFVKTTGKLIGYVKTDSLDEELARLENILSNKADGADASEKPKPQVASKILVYMVKGLANSVASVVACFSVANLSKEALYFYTWEVISALELRGLRVAVLAADGASCNQGFFQMLVSLEPTKSGVVFVTANLVSGRPLFLINDPAHLLKTCRNNLFYSGKVNSRRRGKTQVNKREKGQEKCKYIRLLTKNGETMTWDTVRRVYEEQKKNTLRTTWKLNKKDVELNSFSMMKVPLAAHVLSGSMATELRLYGWPNSAELAVFCRNMNDFFDMVNGLHSFQATRQQNQNLATYTSLEDERFDKLLTILKYFEEWDEEVRRLKQKPKENRFISDQTYTGLERTIRAFIGAVKFVLSEGEGEDPKPYVNGRTLSSDDLEKYFSKLRGMFGSNRHPDLQQAIQATVKMHSRSSLAFQGKKRSNVGKGTEISLADLTAPKTKKARRSL